MSKEIMNKEIIENLRFFQEGYIKRDLDSIDNFMDTLFDKNDNILIVGTSDGEWCIGYEEAKNLFLSDWEYWGDLRIDIEEAVISLTDNAALVFVPGTVKYSFSDSDERYSRYIDFVKRYFQEDSSDSRKSNKVKLAEINWVLCHLLHQREDCERNYLWKLGVSFVFVKKADRWVIRQMQFSLPVMNHFPDERIYQGSPYGEAYEKEQEKINIHSKCNNCTSKDEIKEILNALQSGYLNASTPASKLVSDLISTEEPLFINTDQTMYKGTEKIKEIVDKNRNIYDDFDLNLEQAIIDYHGDAAWLACNGMIRRHIKEDEAFESALKEIKNIFDSEEEDKERLFKIRRIASGIIKENYIGEEYLWPVRFEAVLHKRNDKWLFRYIQISFPFNIILEGKTDASVVQ